MKATKIFQLVASIRYIGYQPGQDGPEQYKLAIFNVLNFMGLINGVIIPFAGLFNDDRLPLLAWVVACSPAFISFAVLYCNYRHKHELGRILYFTLYPISTSLVYVAGLDLGIELFFIFYAILSVFLMKHTFNVLLCLALSLSLYFVVSVLWQDYSYRLVTANYSFFVFNQFLAIVFTFCCLYLFKKETNSYQFRLLRRNNELSESKTIIEQQKKELEERARELERKTIELQELDVLKNKLFSVIAHDLKSPMYALRNLFRNVQQFDIPGDEIKLLIPEVVTDLNYTTGLMENLLQWAKTQMQSDAIRVQHIDIAELIKEVIQLLRLQAESKKVYLDIKVSEPVHIFADRDILNLVLRNLLSNAIKFTPEAGLVTIGASGDSSAIEIFVEDNGTGMDETTLKRIQSSTFYTSKGTANESGTGLGLMLCREYLTRIGGKMFIESEVGKGSVFSFIVPASQS